MHRLRLRTVDPDIDSRLVAACCLQLDVLVLSNSRRRALFAVGSVHVASSDADTDLPHSLIRSLYVRHRFIHSIEREYTSESRPAVCACGYPMGWTVALGVAVPVPVPCPRISVRMRMHDAV